MAEPNPISNSLRIAVALTALRHKPSQQSIADYVQDLVECFSSPQGAHAYWRKRAQNAEQVVETLKAEIQRDHDMRALISDNSQAPASFELNNKPVQKDTGKRKKKATASPEFDISLVWKDIVTSQAALPQLLLCDLQLMELLFKHNQILNGQRPEAQVLPLLQRCIAAIGKILASALSNPIEIMLYQTAQRTSSLLPLLLLRSLPLIPSDTPRDDVERLLLSELFCNIVRPSVKSLHQIGLARAQCQLNSAFVLESQLPKFDPRPSLFELCQRTLEVTRNRVDCGPTLFTMAAAEASRELERLCRIAVEPHACKETGSISRIVLRDTIWYLCALISTGLSVDVDLDAASASSNSFVRSSILQSLCRLLRTRDNGLEFDAMEHRLLTKVLGEVLATEYTFDEPDSH